MYGVLMVVSLLLAPQGTARQEGIFEVVLQSLRAEQPEVPLYLVNRPVEHFEDSPRTAGSGLMHDPEWVQDMQRRDTISGSCTPPKHMLGCPCPNSLPDEPHMSAEFWPLESTDGDQVTVTVTLALPALRAGVANLERREYAVARTGAGQWRVVSWQVAGVT